MININIKDNPELYFDFEKSLEFLDKIKMEDYKYPKDVTNFHIYTEFKNEKEIMCLKSYLATQDLEKTKMIIWSDYDITDNELVKPFLDYVTLKVYNPHEEAVGTVLESRPELDMKDKKYYLQSDLLRLLVLHKYGGVWADMDIIFLRDFKPLLDQEWMYMWGSETDFEKEGACATVISLHKESQLSLEFLKELMVTNARPETACWGKEMFAEVYKRFKYDILPSTFFNTEWHINAKYPGLGDKIESGWWEKNEYSNHLFTEAFSWHWHNTTHEKAYIEPESKFGLMKTMIDNELYERGILK